MKLYKDNIIFIIIFIIIVALLLFLVIYNFNNKTNNKYNYNNINKWQKNILTSENKYVMSWNDIATTKINNVTNVNISKDNDF